MKHSEGMSVNTNRATRYSFYSHPCKGLTASARGSSSPERTKVFLKRPDSEDTSIVLRPTRKNKIKSIRHQ